MKKNNNEISETVKKRIQDSKHLKYGDIVKIAKVAGMTKQSVHSFIKGKSNSNTIDKVFQRFVSHRKIELEKLIKKELQQ